MPASPALRISPGKELRTENHKRGRSLERGIAIDEKEDELALFKEAQNKERENFLLQSNDDFSDIFSTKLRHMSDSKAGFSASARGESSDLLNAVDKNDYDWLITPPESPLFPSLDDEAPGLHATRGRQRRSQPMAVSRMVEKGHRSTRGSPSPSRLSPSPRSGNTVLQARSRPHSASHSSPPRTFTTHTSPSRRLSPSPSKLTPAVISGTPTLRRASTGSASGKQSRTRGTSPVKTSLGHSASLKTMAWQSNIPGFSNEAPPNLRTSLADRPGSYVRGSSPASRNSSGSGRQSISPTASRSVSSSHSHEKDPFGYYSKCSVASSGDDDFETQPSNSATLSDQSCPQNFGSLQYNRSLGVSRKPIKDLPSSAPKRPMDVVLRQDKKGPHMFRPLLSSVQSSTFYLGKPMTQSRSLTSKDSSLTSNSNLGSDPSISGALDAAVCEQIQDDMTSIILKKKHSAANEEPFDMDTIDALNKDADKVIAYQPGNDDPSSFFLPLVVADSNNQADSTILVGPAEIALDGKYSYASIDGDPGMELCCRCQRRFHSLELIMEGDQLVCLKCKNSEFNPTSLVPVEFSLALVDACSAELIDAHVPSPAKTVKDHLGCAAAGKGQYLCCKKDLATSLTEEPELNMDCEPGRGQNQLLDFCLNSKFDIHEVEGFSLLLKRSSSVQRRILPSRSFTASYTSYDDFSYMRDSLTSLRSSVGQSSPSMSSSLDLAFSRPAEARLSPGSTVDGFEVITKIKNNQVAAESGSMDTESGIICKTTDSGENLLLSALTSDQPSPLEKENKWTRNSVHSAHEETSTSNLQLYDHVEDIQRSSCFDAQVPQSSDFCTADVPSPDSHSNLDSTNPKCILVGNVSVEQDGHISTSVNEPHGFEVSTIACKDQGGSRTLAHEEAKDVILLCSSIVDDRACNAEDIAISEVVSPAPEYSSKPLYDRREMRPRTLARRSSNSQKTRPRKTEMETKSPQSVLAEHKGKYTPRIVLSPASMGSNTVPPKLESKCNCTIM